MNLFKIFILLIKGYIQVVIYAIVVQKEKKGNIHRYRQRNSKRDRER